MCTILTTVALPHFSRLFGARSILDNVKQLVLSDRFKGTVRGQQIVSFVDYNFTTIGRGGRHFDFPQVCLPLVRVLPLLWDRPQLLEICPA